MDEHDLDGRALLVVVGCEGDLDDADNECEHCRSGKPWQGATAESQEAGWIGKLDHAHRVSLCPYLVGGCSGCYVWFSLLFAITRNAAIFQDIAVALLHR